MDDQKINLLEPQDLPLAPRPKNKTKRLGFLFIGMAIIAILLIKNHGMAKWPGGASDYDPITLQPKRIGLWPSVKNFIFKSNSIMIGQKDDRINILLLGIGGPGHDGAYLSDTNIILSIKPSTKQVSMISVPRDLSVKIPGHGTRKINNANAFGEAAQSGNGGEYARKIFEDTFGISIPYYARVDFTAFKELLDTIGGVNIDVERSFIDSAYPGEHDSYQTVIFDAGPQHMDGDRALIFSRSRHGSNGEGSDFARAKRQQMVLAAFKKKLLSTETFLNPITLQRIISSLSQHITTNIEFGQMMFLASLAKEINTDEVKTLVLDDSPNGFLKSVIGDGGAYLLLPKSGDFSEVQTAINNIFVATSTPTVYAPDEKKTVAPTQSMVIPSAIIDIQNGTWRAGLAASKKQELEKDGIFISNLANSAKRPIANTTIYIFNKNTPDKLITTLAAKLKAPYTTNLPEWLKIAYTQASTSSTEPKPVEPDIVIILGEDAL
jgi:LCP family protein required for cell wall assembly